jgi:hypothetical protein
MGVDIGETKLNLGDPMRVGSGLGFLQQAGAFDIGGKHRVDQRGFTAWGFLRHGADLGIARQADGARFRLEIAQDQMEEGRFAHAIAPDEADLVAVGNGDAGVFEEKPSGNAVGESVNMQHGRAV